MKKIFALILLLSVGTFTNTLLEVKAETTNTVKVMDSADSEVMERPGKQIHQVTINGYTLTYTLTDLSHRGEMLETFKNNLDIGMNMSPDVTNHLMVYITDSEQKIVPGSALFHLTNPEGKDYRTIAMGMIGGYGWDVILQQKGLHTIRTRIILETTGNLKIEDEFKYEVK